METTLCEAIAANDESFIRIVMNNTGSVMRLLESLFAESIKAKSVNQHYYQIDNNEWEDITGKENILMRNVFLEGSRE